MYRYKFLGKELDDITMEELRDSECGFGAAIRILALREMARISYAEYLRTDHWSQVKREAWERAKGKCVVCTSRDNRRDVHHLTYENLGCEGPKDTALFCEECHEQFHKTWEHKSRANPPLL